MQIGESIVETIMRGPACKMAVRWWLSGFIAWSVVRANSDALKAISGPTNPNAFSSQDKVFGDLILTNTQYNYFYGPVTPGVQHSYVNPTMKWDQYHRNGRYEIAYKLVGSTFGSSYSYMHAIMQRVEADFLKKTNIRLGNKDTVFRHHRHWMQLQGNLGGCWSHLGRTVNSGGQQISLGNGCHYQSTTTHELMHALGWHHEQNRADRDSYISILWDNIIPAQRHNFQIARGSNHFGTPYEVDSLMQYPSDAFAYPGRHTMRSRGTIRIPTSAEYFRPAKTNRGLTRYDAYEINQVYKKKGTKPKPVTVKPPTTKRPTTDDCEKDAMNSQGAVTRKRYEKGFKTVHTRNVINNFYVQNKMSYTVNTYWMSYTGKPTFYGSLSPGQRALRKTYYGHSWFATNSANQVVVAWKSIGHFNIDNSNVNYFLNNGCDGGSKKKNRCTGVTGPEGSGFFTKLAYSRGIPSQYRSHSLHNERVYNKLSYSVDIYWIGTNKAEKKYETVRAGGSWPHQTYSGNTWIVKSRGSAVAGWVSGSKRDIVITSGKAAYFKDNSC